jgi:nicotinic acid mononucleotide adenylyltransferase
VFFIDDVEHPASSTDIRKSIGSGDMKYLDNKVAEYIKEQGLYKCSQK